MAGQYSVEGYVFDLDTFLPQRIFDRITDIRVYSPDVIERQAKARKRRPRITTDGTLTILAADHPGRGVTQLGDDPFKMGDRREYLGRILRVLMATDFDGFMSTPDMIEDLLIVDYLVQTGGGASFLDGKVLVGCMQRGGVAGFAGELDDRFGSYTAESIHRFNLDGGKMMVRFVRDDERTLLQVDYCSKAITELNRYELTPFVEALRLDYEPGETPETGQWIKKNTADELLKLAGVLSAMGDSSRHTWLKLPYCEDFGKVANATSLPILMLGGPSREDPRHTYQEFVSGMATRANIRGALVGRNVTFPGPEDPAAVGQAIYGIVHERASADEAIETTMARRDHKMNALTAYVK